MGSIKDRNGRDLTEAEDIKKRGQEYAELYKKDLNDADNHNGVIIHLESDILKCEVKWALGSPDWKRSVFIPIPKKGNAKECSNYYTIALTSHASKVMLKSLQVRLNSTWAKNFQMFKLDIEKAEEPETKLTTSLESQKKQENSRKMSTSASLTTLKPVTVCITTNCGKFFKRWEYHTWPPSWEICMHVRKQQLEPDMEQQTGSKLGKEYVKAIYCYSAYLTYMQSTSCEISWWIKHKLESRLPGKISITSDTQMTSPLWQKSKN